MSTNKESSWLILVLEEIEEIRDGIEKLLKTDNYQVETARTVTEAILKAKHQPPGLVLICLASSTTGSIQVAKQLRQEAGLMEHVPVVIFGLEELAEGAEVAIEGNIHLTQPDNFNQLRATLRRLLVK